MRAIIEIVLTILDLYWYVIVISAVLSWLLAFNVINYSNNFVRSIWDALNALTEPLLRPIRNRLPQMGAIDISPIILLLAIALLRKLIEYNIAPMVIGF